MEQNSFYKNPYEIIRYNAVNGIIKIILDFLLKKVKNLFENFKCIKTQLKFLLMKNK